MPTNAVELQSHPEFVVALDNPETTTELHWYDTREGALETYETQRSDNGWASLWRADVAAAVAIPLEWPGSERGASPPHSAWSSILSYLRGVVNRHVLAFGHWVKLREYGTDNTGFEVRSMACSWIAVQIVWSKKRQVWRTDDRRDEFVKFEHADQAVSWAMKEVARLIEEHFTDVISKRDAERTERGVRQERNRAMLQNGVPDPSRANTMGYIITGTERGV